ncbi:hypothetical protein [Variovorax sp. LjRoot175]|uniref:hypothetical protein n=1 Tax=Variovorax sp. LjRoot175 TaxID=3342276 RepID=UPI003F50E863
MTRLRGFAHERPLERGHLPRRQSQSLFRVPLRLRAEEVRPAGRSRALMGSWMRRAGVVCRGASAFEAAS